jgi:hypothetical protein
MNGNRRKQAISVILSERSKGSGSLSCAIFRAAIGECDWQSATPAQSILPAMKDGEYG